MANTYKDIIITPNRSSSTADPNISFRGGNTASNTEITLRVYPDSNGTLSFEGAAGQLFSITNDLTGSIFSVNDVSGIPSIEVFANGEIRLAQYSGNVEIGGTNPTHKLEVNGAVAVTNTGGSVISAMYGNIYTTSAVTSYTVDTFPSATYRSARYFAQQSSGTTYGVIELNLVHDGANVFLAQYGENKTNSSANLGVFDAAISSGSLNLTYTPGSVYTAQTLKISRIAVAN
jgi:hypothetical protein